MRLLLKINLILLLVLGSGLALTLFWTKRALDESARDSVRAQAELMMDAARATRKSLSQ